MPAYLVLKYGPCKLLVSALPAPVAVCIAELHPESGERTCGFPRSVCLECVGPYGPSKEQLCLVLALIRDPVYCPASLLTACRYRQGPAIHGVGFEF